VGRAVGFGFGVEDVLLLGRSRRRVGVVPAFTWSRSRGGHGFWRAHVLGSRRRGRLLLGLGIAIGGPLSFDEQRGVWDVSVDVRHAPTLSKTPPATVPKRAGRMRAMVFGAGLRHEHKAAVMVLCDSRLLNLVEERVLVDGAPRVDRRLTLGLP
jgi:hypothetical protein